MPNDYLRALMAVPDDATEAEALAVERAAFVAEQERLFTPAPEPMPGQTELDTPDGWDG